MRTYGRITDEAGNKTWVEVDTAPDGSNDAVWLTTLCQCLLLNLGESPRFANFGIPGQQSVMSQLFPDFYVNQTQQQFSPYFASLIIAKLPKSTPTYQVNAITNNGVTIQQKVPF